MNINKDYKEASINAYKRSYIKELYSACDIIDSTSIPIQDKIILKNTYFTICVIKSEIIENEYNKCNVVVDNNEISVNDKKLSNDINLEVLMKVLKENKINYIEYKKEDNYVLKLSKNKGKVS